jgi:chromosome segregation protein
MQLSKLEIKGFKSFGDKVTIHFDKGVTGIVGPNGCGKSNVVDAIRWVLGEQKTRNLRSDKMENLIFNGTRNRKPLQMAEVSLTFLNTKNILPTEYSSVTIGRRYFRDGESEYLLNGVSCRLKDITNLFLDTGIGPDSYAIIELKMVDDILSDRENSRRSLLEEAAGVSKFKIRKKETFRKLEDTEADLNRLEDVLFEIRKNMKALEKQARQAEEYYGIKENYKTAAIAHARLSMAASARSLQDLKKKIAVWQEERTALSTDMATREAALESVKSGLLQEEKTLSSRQKTLNDFVSRIREIENRKKIREDRLRFYEERREKLVAEQGELLERENGLQLKKEENEKRTEEVQKQLNAAAEELILAKEEMDHARLGFEEKHRELEELGKNLRTGEQELYQLGKNLEFNEAQQIDLENEREKTESESKDQSVFLQHCEEKLQQLNGQLSEKEKAVSETEEKEIRLQEEIAQTIEEGEKIRQSLAGLYRNLDARQNEFNLLKAMVENLEGFPEAVKFLRKNKSWSKKAPLVADLLNIDEKYKAALESVLEPFLNHYVVQSETEAYLAMKLLSENLKGKASFLILDRLKSHPVQKAKAIPDAIPAMELVEYEAQYENLVSYILGDVYITDKTIPFAASSSTGTQVLFGELAWDWADQTVVSITGAMTRRKYALSGGSNSVLEGNKIGKAVQLKKLEDEISSLNLLIHNEKINEEQSQEKLIELRQSTGKSLIEHLKNEIAQLRREEAALQARKDQSIELIRNSSLRKEGIEQKINQLRESSEAIRPKLKSLQFHVEQVKQKLEEEEKLNTNRTEASRLATIRYNQLNIEHIQKQNALLGLEQTREYLLKESTELGERSRRTSEELGVVESEKEKLGEGNIQDEQELPALYEEKEAIEAGLNEAERSYFEVRGKIDLAEKEIRESGRKREQVTLLIEESQEKLSQGQSQLVAIQERIHVEFETLISWEEELPEPNSEEEAQQLKKMQQIRQQLDRMGPINLMAREAYQEIKERHDFIETQKRDLMEARQSLTDTISEIESVARTHFQHTFEKVQENFKMVFRSLFTEEDTCDLVLQNPAEPLESAIDIMARPKGKRPLTINQLSGGEKTLTAISLLFAIYLIKPAPFCIFDEADAPLDDTNIDKFNKIIRKFSNESQFILVTHNKRTMASTDVIYGVTMPEQGVSRVIPVDLRELA